MILSLDLGVTTGFALWTADGILHSWGEISSSPQPSLLPVSPSEIERVLVELPVFKTGALGDKLLTISRDWREVFSDVPWDVIPPGVWKTSPRVQSLFPRGATRHARDAIGVGLWFFLSHHMTPDLSVVVRRSL